MGPCCMLYPRRRIKHVRVSLWFPCCRQARTPSPHRPHARPSHAAARPACPLLTALTPAASRPCPLQGSPDEPAGASCLCTPFTTADAQMRQLHHGSLAHVLPSHPMLPCPPSLYLSPGSASCPSNACPLPPNDCSDDGGAAGGRNRWAPGYVGKGQVGTKICPGPHRLSGFMPAPRSPAAATKPAPPLCLIACPSLPCSATKPAPPLKMAAHARMRSGPYARLCMDHATLIIQWVSCALSLYPAALLHMDPQALKLHFYPCQPTHTNSMSAILFGLYSLVLPEC